MPNDLVERTDDGRLRLHFHAGQWRAWNATQRFVIVLAGTQGGKTSFGPHWLYREIQRAGPGDYMVVTPTFPLLEVKALPVFRALFEAILQLGEYVASPVRHFRFSDEGARRTFGKVPDEPTNVYFGYAADQDSLESATAKAVWGDEAGQKRFKHGSWEALLRRLSLHRGRALLTTTPYYLGWLKKLCDRARLLNSDVAVVRFASTANPMFSREEFERARNDMPAWKFNMFYRGVFERPAGLIYDVFNEKAHTCQRFEIPTDWRRYIGLDFGGINTAAVLYAEHPDTGVKYAYREYHAGQRVAAEHAKALLNGEPTPSLVVGGSRSEGQWRKEFAYGGLAVREPKISSVEIGIDRVYGAHKRNEIVVFDDLAGYLDQKASYSRVLDDEGEPTEEIEDKATYHYMDAERYIIGYLARNSVPGSVAV